MGKTDHFKKEWTRIGIFLTSHHEHPSTFNNYLLTKRVGNNPLWINKMDAYEKRATASGLNPSGVKSKWSLSPAGIERRVEKALRCHVSWNLVVWGKC
jgi:hypothetical protein